MGEESFICRIKSGKNFGNLFTVFSTAFFYLIKNKLVKD